MWYVRKKQTTGQWRREGEKERKSYGTSWTAVRSLFHWIAVRARSCIDKCASLHLTHCFFDFFRSLGPSPLPFNSPWQYCVEIAVGHNGLAEPIKNTSLISMRCLAPRRVQWTQRNHNKTYWLAAENHWIFHPLKCNWIDGVARVSCSGNRAKSHKTL